MRLKKLLLEVASVGKLKQRLKKFIFTEMYDEDFYQKKEVESEILSFDEWKKFKWEGMNKKEGENRFQIKFKKIWLKDGLNLDRIPPRRKYRDKLEDYFNQLVSDLGWFVSKVVISGKSSKSSFVRVQFEKEETNTVNVPSKLYHVTLKDNLDSIMSDGIVPNTGEKRDFLYPERVFFFTERNEELFQRFLVNKFSYHMTPQQMTHTNIAVPPVAILEIDTTKLAENVNFYEDLDMPNAVWADQTIPSKAVEVVDYMYEEDR